MITKRSATGRRPTNALTPYFQQLLSFSKTFSSCGTFREVTNF